MCRVGLLAVDVADGIGAVVESIAGGGPAVLVDVESGTEVGGAHPLEDRDALGAFVGGLGDFVSWDSAEGVLSAVEGDEVVRAGAVGVGIGEPVRAAAGPR